ncbi:MAG: ribonuclease D, partial [Candidatus Sumerlaeota bacterium]|nr:ribonuclease D [Candidatus Sumerlaeota bacterium]
MICPDSPAPLHIPPHSYIDRSAALQRILPDLEKADRLAVDTEADSLHHYFEKVCLMQISSPSRHNYIIDPLAGFDLGPLLNILSAKLLVIHGADYDLRLLRRTFGFSADALYDTSIAAQILGYPAFGLSALMERHFRLAMPKTSQRADWSRRPLTLDMLAYAVNDTAHLLRLADLLEGELRAAGRSAWREQTCRRLIEDA